MLHQLFAGFILAAVGSVLIVVAIATAKETFLYDWKPEWCGWLPFQHHDGVEFHVTKGSYAIPQKIAVFKVCRRCKVSYSEDRMESPDEFEARQEKKAL